MNADGTGQRKLTSNSGADFFGDVPQTHLANQAIRLGRRLRLNFRSW